MDDLSPDPPPPSPGRAVWTYALGLAPGIAVWLVLAGWLASLLYARAGWPEEADAALMREWLDEARIFRKTLPELVREYVRLRDDQPDRAAEKRDEVAEQLRALAEPTRLYPTSLPAFPAVYLLEVAVAGGPGGPDRIAWASPLARPRETDSHRVRVVEFTPAGLPPGKAAIRCEYQLHAYDRLRQREDDRRRVAYVAAATLVAATALAGLFVGRFLARERRREVERLSAVGRAEHRRREALEARLRQRDAERERDDTDRRLLEQQLAATLLQKRADEAEKAALELKSQLYAGIGVMAGSYAHNIKNLLVRPNDLLARCLEADGLPGDQAAMLHEVRDTLGTVTDRLQQILKTVRRDPAAAADVARVDLAALVRDTAAAWAGMGRDKWKLAVDADVPADGPVWVTADRSHLQQALENLLFNARDATFEMRGRLRDDARREPDPAARRAKLLAAAGWVGRVTLAVRRDADRAVLEVRDNGVGMTPEVRARCLDPHFTTKRDDAVYQGHSAGMGLGLSFVATVLDRHKADLAIDTAPRAGAAFRVRFPPADGG